MVFWSSKQMSEMTSMARHSSQIFSHLWQLKTPLYISLHLMHVIFFFSSRRRHTRFDCDWSSDVCSYDLVLVLRHRQDAERDRQIAAGEQSLDPGECQRPRGLDRAQPRVRHGGAQQLHEQHPDRKSVVEGKSVDLGGRRIIKKKKSQRGG